MADYMMSNEFKTSDVAYFQKFFDLFTERGVFSRKVDVSALLYKG
jgi:NitT/TauT family transport system substrate-binding protein